MSLDRLQFRRAMSRFATGVTVVTVRAGERLHGMTVNSFASVSLDPPLVLWCAEKGARTLRLIEESGVYAVSILAEDQQDLSQRFATRSSEGEDRFAGVAWSPGPATGCPLLTGALATLECRMVHEYEAGDHRILIARVEAMEIAPTGQPLLYFGSRYRLLSSPEEDRAGLPPSA